MRKSTSLLGLVLLAVLFGGAGCISFSNNDSATNGPAGIFVTLDAGENWQHISLLPQADGVKTLSEVSVYRLVEDPSDTKALYWPSRGHGLFYSYNNGTSWQQVAEPLNGGFIYSVAIHPKDKCTIFGTNGTKLYKSDDCSRSWKLAQEEQNSSNHISSIAINPFSPNQIFIAKTNGDIIQSVDEGKSWNAIHRLGSRLEQLQFDPLDKDVAYLATRDQGLFRSTDAGKTWTDISASLKDFSGAKEYRRLYLHSTKKGVLYWISTYGILVSQNRGDSWQPMTLITAPGGANIYAFGLNPKNDQDIYYTATINNTSLLYHSVDGGKNWITKKLPSGQLPTALRVHPDGNVVYVGFTIPPKQ